MSSPRNPPSGFVPVIKYLGPGLILAGSVVGSGELIATTRTGAEAGFSLLWLILVGCVIKVFAQVEICRHCITHGETTVTTLYRIPHVGKAIAWFWLITFLTGLGQLGGIVGGVGQALQITFPWFGERSDLWWAAIVTILTVLMLLRNSFTFIEVFCTFLVTSFTLITVGNVFALQYKPDFAISGKELLEGLRFGLPPEQGALITALAAFGIIGIGAAELVAYPYWCLEKGYGNWIGKRDGSPEWEQRARGWIRVLRWDSWLSMVLYTTSTAAFYVLGAAVLHRMGLIPAKSEMIATLAEIYEPVFGTAGRFVLLAGAFAVLFSTFFVSNATKARLMTDALHVFRIRRLEGDAERNRSVRWFSVAFPILCFSIYVLFPKPVLLVVISGLMQALLLPMLGIAALYFRFATIHPSLKPGRLWDICLVLSTIAFLVVGGYIGWTQGSALLSLLAGNSG